MIDTIVRVYRYLLSYTKRYHGDLYVLVLDKYAETFPAQTRGSGKGCRAKQIALRKEKKRKEGFAGLYKSVLELWYAKGHSSKRLQLDLGMQGGRARDPAMLSLRHDTTESRPQVQQYFHEDAVYSGSLEPSPWSSLT